MGPFHTIPYVPYKGPETFRIDGGPQPTSYPIPLKPQCFVSILFVVHLGHGAVHRIKRFSLEVGFVRGMELLKRK